MTPAECMAVAVAIAAAGEREAAEGIAMSVLVWAEQGAGHASAQAVRMSLSHGGRQYWKGLREDHGPWCHLIREPRSGMSYAEACGVRITGRDGHHRSLVDILSEIVVAEADEPPDPYARGLRSWGDSWGEAVRLLVGIRTGKMPPESDDGGVLSAEPMLTGTVASGVRVEMLEDREMLAGHHSDRSWDPGTLGHIIDTACNPHCESWSAQRDGLTIRVELRGAYRSDAGEEVALALAEASPIYRFTVVQSVPWHRGAGSPYP